MHCMNKQCPHNQYISTILLSATSRSASTNSNDSFYCVTTDRCGNFGSYTLIITSGTCKCKWLVLRKLFFGSTFVMKLRATVSAILADSFITSPRWPVSSSDPSLLSSWGRLVVVSMYSVDPPENAVCLLSALNQKCYTQLLIITQIKHPTRCNIQS